MADTIHAALAVVDIDLRVISANAVFATTFGLKPAGGPEPAGVVGRALRDLAHPVFAHPQLIDLLSRIRAGAGGPDRAALTVDAPDGVCRQWGVTALLLPAPSSGPPTILLTLDDVTEERRIIQQQLQLMIDALPGFFIVLDSRQRIRFVSRQVGSLFGYRAEELIGNQVEMLVPPDLRQRHAKLRAGFAASPAVRPMASGLGIQGFTKDGRTIPVDIGLSPLPTADGPLVIAEITDLRLRKQGEDRLREAKRAADRANQAKTRFLAAASHDLRQPLQTIGLLHGILRRRLVDTDSRDVLAKLDNAVADMTAVLDTLLDINRIESGGIMPQISEFPVADVLTRACEQFEPLAAAKSLALCAVPSSATIRSDPRLLSRMLGNLLSNAIKYTDSGRILLGARRRGEALRIEVWDTGIGIPADSINAVFEEFYRVDHPNRSQVGLGLGLYIVQRLAQILGHTVEVRSVPGKGTMLAVTVAVAGPPAAPIPVGRVVASAALRPAVLVVEDDLTLLHTLGSLLELEGYRVATAHTGAEALTRLREPGSLRPDCAIVDYNLTGGSNGLDAIRSMEAELGRRIPALILSGDKSAPAQDAIEASGYDLLIKPVQAGRLLTAVEALARTARPEWHPDPAPAIAAARTAPARPGFDIAVIDDEPGVRDALRATLAAEGYEAATFGSGEAFLADAARSRFACLVVDIGLPGMDGLALQQRLKADRVEVPMIFVTGRTDLPLAVQAMREGAADFLQKPVLGTELCDSVARALERCIQTTASRPGQEDLAARLATLTGRERQVMQHMLRGELTKNIAVALGISQRTTEHHRQSVMHKMGVKSLAMLIRMMLPHGA